MIIFRFLHRICLSTILTLQNWIRFGKLHWWRCCWCSDDRWWIPACSSKHLWKKKKIIFHRDSQHGQLAAFALCFPSPAPKVCFREGHAVLKAKFVCRVLLESIRSTAWRHDYWSKIVEIGMHSDTANSLATIRSVLPEAAQPWASGGRWKS